MAAFQGYLFKATGASAAFPMKYIDETTWESTPNQREELKAYRDDNTRDLTRVTAAGRKTAISFETRSGLHKADKEAIQSYFTSNESDATQRRISLTYWNDEENNYKQGDFYRPNLTFKIKKITGNDIIYDKVKIDLVEY